MTTVELWRGDAAALSKRLEEGAVASADLLEMYLARCDRLEPAINAFAFLDREGARRAAEQSDARRRAGRALGPLDGIPVCVKDNIYVAGMPACWGSRLYRDFVPERDDICVERLRAAGAVIVGKTNTPEFALMGRTQSRLKGVTRNPWDPRLTPGGSSGGAVAAVSAAMAPLAIGTDAGGSTRMPASYTGLVGLRPSNGRVPRRYGFMPMALDFQAIGLIARTMADLDLLLGALSGPDPRDPTSVNAPPLAPTGRPLKIGWFTRIDAELVDAEVENAHELARAVLASLGHRLEECAPPFDIAELRGIWDTLTAVGAARAALSFADWRTELTDQIRELTQRAATLLAIDYVRALDRLQAFRAETSGRWGAFDALLLPTASSPAWPAEEDCPRTIGGLPGSSATQAMFCGWVNALGFSGLSVPGLSHPDGRPIGLQIVAPFGRDAVALEIGRQLEAQAPSTKRWPALAESVT